MPHTLYITHARHTDTLSVSHFLTVSVHTTHDTQYINIHSHRGHRETQFGHTHVHKVYRPTREHQHTSHITHSTHHSTCERDSILNLLNNATFLRCSYILYNRVDVVWSACSVQRRDTRDTQYTQTKGVHNVIMYILD